MPLARTLSEFAVSHLSDNVIALNYYKDRGSLKRAISVIKTRASRHESSTSQYDIGSHGITIGDIAQPDEKTDPLHTPAPQTPAGNLPK